LNKIISFGGGVNSVAMTIMLYKRGEIYPLVFADTMAEHPETYCYMDYFEREFLSKYGQKIIKITPFETPQYYWPAQKGISLEDYFIKCKSVPLAFQPACSVSYKRHPLSQYAMRPHIIGFALDEKNRATNDIYPLIENSITRQGCINIIRNEGLKIPRKSGCFFCANQRICEWEELYRKNSELYKRAMALENNSHLTIRSDYSLTILKERFEAQGWKRLIDYDYEELTPCMCIT